MHLLYLWSVMSYVAAVSLFINEAKDGFLMMSASGILCGPMSRKMSSDYDYY